MSTTFPEQGEYHEAPVFSIVIPVYNRTEALKQAVDSCIAQTFQAWELIVVDDGSQVPASVVMESVSDTRVRCMALAQNSGVSTARNTGIRAARGRYVAFLDSDDVFETDKLGCCYKTLSERGFPDDLVLTSRLNNRRPGGHQAAIPGHLMQDDEEILHYLFVRGGIVSTDTIVVPLQKARECLYKENLSRHEDYDFMWRLQRSGARFHMQPEALATWNDLSDPNRLTSTTGYEESRQWIESIRSEISKPLYCAFQLRVLGTLASARKPFSGLPVFLKNARGASSMSIRARLLCLLKCTSPGFYRRLTNFYVFLNRNTDTQH